ncbi:MAG: PEP-CTERM sorting domain-containing protein [Betaproteobacteria bacterium]
MTIKHLLLAATILAMPTLAIAGFPNPVPEPETLALLGVGAIALVVARWRKRK